MAQPSAAYRQQHDVAAPRVDERHYQPAWRKLTRLDQLLGDKLITTAQWHAAADFRELCELCLIAGFGRPLNFEGGGAGAAAPNDAPAARLDALAELRKITARLGAGPCRLLTAALVEDLSWAELGRRLAIDPHTAKDWVITAIRALAAI